MVSDDAGQFKILGLLHGLCWLHAERSIRKLVPLSLREQEAVDGRILLAVPSGSHTRSA